MAKKIFISCGELSGEQHAANLAEALKDLDSHTDIYAMGSKLLEKAGAKLLIDYRDYSFSGFTEVIQNLSQILKLKDSIIEKLLKIKPDVVILVDYAGFNLELAKGIHEKFAKAGIQRPRIIEFIAPQIWASRPWRINKIKKYIDKVLCTLPFEEKIYQGKNIPVQFVGNPVAASLRVKYDKASLYEELNINADYKNEILIGLFPGSRKSEIQYMYPLMQKAALELNERNPLRNFRFLIARAPNLNEKVFENFSLANDSQEDINDLITIIDPESTSSLNHKLLSTADCLWLCSGTVTLEAALYEVPYFLAYKSTFINYIFYLIFRITKMAGLANIISGKYMVKEFLQYDASVDNFVNETENWLSGDGYSNYYYLIKENLHKLRKELQARDTFYLVAQEVLK